MQRRKSGRRIYRPKENEKWICAKCGEEISSLSFESFRDENGNLLRPIYHKHCLPSNK